VTTRAFRITVRGTFDGLSDEQHDALLAGAAEHEILRAEFTPEGHLTYDLAARAAFTFRFLESGEKPEDLAAATQRAEAAAVAWLGARGYGFKHLRSTATDVAELPLGKRGRRAAARAEQG
jgi:hypothetical protein